MTLFVCLRWLRLLVSVVFEVSYPLGPVGWLDTSCECPGAVSVEFAMPFELPEFFQVYFSCGEVQHRHVDGSIVPVYAAAGHAVAAPGIKLILGRALCWEWPDVESERVDVERHSVGTGDVWCFPAGGKGRAALIISACGV